MTDIQSRQLELLKEIDEICTQNGISYFLCDGLAVMAERTGGFEPDFYGASVIMPAGDMRKFVKRCRRAMPADRYLESMQNNGWYPRLSLRYGNRNTLDLNTTDWGHYQNHGIHVEIELMRYGEGMKFFRKWANRLEIGWEAYNGHRELSPKRRKTDAERVSRLCKRIGRRTTAKLIFRFLTSPFKLNKHTFFRRKYWKMKRETYAAEWFSGTVRVPFEDTSLPIPSGYEAFFHRRYRDSWRERTFGKPINPATRLVDPDLPFADYFTALREEGIDPEAVWKLRDSFARKNQKLAALRKGRRRAWDKLFFAGDRYQMWEAYRPWKQYLRDLREAEDAEGMMEVFAPYHDLVRKYWRRMKTTLVFDPEIFALYQYALRNTGRDNLADKLLKKIPEQHKTEITIRSYDGGELDYGKDTKGMKAATPELLPAILAYLRKKVGNCIYLYIDISKYGLDNPNMSVWYDTDDDGINLVIMRYYDSVQIYSDRDTWNKDQVIDLVREQKRSMVSGQSWIIDRIYPAFESDYKLETGYVFQLTNFREFEEVVPIEKGRVEDVREMAALICSNESIGGYYEVDNLAAQLRERMETGIGRSLVIRRDGKMVAHIATYAEYQNLAVTGGLIAIQDETKIPYGTMLESRLVLDLLSEGYEIYTFVTEARRARFFQAMKCQEYGRYGKMTLK